MGDIQKRKKNYAISKGEWPIVLRNEPQGYDFTIDEVEARLSPYVRCEDREQDIAWAFAKALWWRRNEIKISSALMVGLVRFFEYLEKEAPQIVRLSQIDSELVADYLYYLKYVIMPTGNGGRRKGAGGNHLREGTRSSYWTVFKVIIERLIRESVLNANIKIPQDAFRGKEYEHYVGYSQLERMAIVAACVKEIEYIRSGANKRVYLDVLSDLLPYALLFALRSGVNSEVFFGLPVTSLCLRKGYLPGTERLVLPIKGRSGKSQNISYLEDIPEEAVRIKTRSADLLREVEEITQPIRDKIPAGHPLKVKLWLTEKKPGGRGGKPFALFGNRSYFSSLQTFAKRYDLRDDFGNPLVFNFKRFRPTFAESMLRISGGDIRDLQIRLNHSNIRTTMRYLDPNTEERKAAFRFAGQAMVQWSLGEDGKPDVSAVASDLGVSEEDAQQLVVGDFNMGANKCKNPFDSPLPGQNKGELCDNFLACFRCGNQVVLKEDAHRLFSFYFWLLGKKGRMSKNKWTKSYQWVIDVIDFDIAPQLGDEVWVEQAKREAEERPFSIWSSPRAVMEEQIEMEQI